MSRLFFFFFDQEKNEGRKARKKGRKRTKRKGRIIRKNNIPAFLTFVYITVATRFPLLSCCLSHNLTRKTKKKADWLKNCIKGQTEGKVITSLADFVQYILPALYLTYSQDKEYTCHPLLEFRGRDG